MYLGLVALGAGPEKPSPTRGTVPYIVEEFVLTVVWYIVFVATWAIIRRAISTAVPRRASLVVSPTTQSATGQATAGVMCRFIRPAIFLVTPQAT